MSELYNANSIETLSFKDAIRSRVARRNIPDNGGLQKKMLIVCAG